SLEAEVLAALETLSRPVEARRLAVLFPRRRVLECLRRLEASGAAVREPGDRWRSSGGRRVARLPASPREEICRRWAQLENDPARRVELWLAAGETRRAAEEGEKWYRASHAGEIEEWFAMSALLAGALGSDLPPWLDALEAEREIAGGRPREAESRLARL